MKIAHLALKFVCSCVCFPTLHEFDPLWVLFRSLFSASWQCARPSLSRQAPTPVPRDRIAFGKADGEILREAARQFRLREPRRDERIIGCVTDLHRAEDQVEGRVTIKAIVDGRQRSLSGNLSQLDYGTAIRAHGQQSPVTLVGDLEREGQRWRLMEPRDIRIIEDE
jgi:hypothetical protein